MVASVIGMSTYYILSLQSNRFVNYSPLPDTYFVMYDIIYFDFKYSFCIIFFPPSIVI